MSEKEVTECDAGQVVISAEWQDLLRHTLGANKENRESKHGYRNRFCADVGSSDDKSFEAMVAAGLAERGPTINEGTSVYYRATVAGCEAVGLSKAAIERAFER